MLLMKTALLLLRSTNSNNNQFTSDTGLEHLSDHVYYDHNIVNDHETISETHNNQYVNLNIDRESFFMVHENSSVDQCGFDLLDYVK